MPDFQVIQLGCIPYREAHTEMRKTLGKRISNETCDTLILCTHPPVYTVGRSKAALENIGDPAGVSVEPIERGGDVTFHGPGQLVGYPILQLPKHRRDLHAYLRFIEQFWIDLLANKGVPGGRDPRNTGVWVDGKKMVAIGISCRRWVSWHGFACNHSVDLSYFQRINPCGMSSELVTNLSAHLSSPMGLDELTQQVAAEFPSAWSEWKEISLA